LRLNENTKNEQFLLASLQNYRRTVFDHSYTQNLTAGEQKWRFGYKKRVLSLFENSCSKGALSKAVATFAMPQTVKLSKH